MPRVENVGKVSPVDADGKPTDKPNPKLASDDPPYALIAIGVVAGLFILAMILRSK